MIGLFLLGSCVCVCVLFGSEKKGKVKRRVHTNTYTCVEVELRCMFTNRSALCLPDIRTETGRGLRRVSLVWVCASQQSYRLLSSSPCLQARIGFLCPACLKAFRWGSVKIPCEKMLWETWDVCKGENLNGISREGSFWIGIFARLTQWELRRKNIQPTSSGSVPKLWGVGLKNVFKNQSCRNAGVKI